MLCVRITLYWNLFFKELLFKRIFERTKFKGKKWILKERFLIKQHCPSFSNWTRKNKFWFDSFLLFWGTLVSVSWQDYNSFCAMWLDFFSRPFLKVHPPICRIAVQHMQQCQVRVFHNFSSKIWSKWMVPEKWSL